MLFPDDPDFSEDEARRQLEPMHGTLLAAVNDAAEAVRYSGEQIPLIAKAYSYLSTRQKVMNSAVVERVKELVVSEDLADAEITAENKFLELKLAQIDLRFKQVDKAGRTANYPTETNDRYKNQLPLIPVGPDVVRPRLTLGWRWNATQTDIENVVVVYAKGDDIRWMYSILRDEAGAVPAVPMPTADPSGRGATFGDKAETEGA